MSEFAEDPWFDDDAGRLVRPYTVSNGRTQPTAKMDLLSMVMTTGQVSHRRLDIDHAQALSLCHQPISVAEVAAHMRLPATVTKILLSDLVDVGAVATRAPSPTADPTDTPLLETLLDGLQRRL
ncbi:MAG TPA: DUF742 domain-containing protein [Stackebrandtia sp.]|uniref:DUF742 domain-containing protein n=1 Tax=Stackebrandtia sp. TaxID=2023065 RepID=UPI002D2B7C3A|nr:DUF742 domain-containing protein [Stackebrandtia sp.]HZE41051.1 DUF742 domain-containing protein [Stackebrandtia sp.]